METIRLVDRLACVGHPTSSQSLVPIRPTVANEGKKCTYLDESDGIQEPFGIGKFKKVYEGFYTQGFRIGHPVVCKKCIVDQEVGCDLIWQSDLDAVTTASKIVESFNNSRHVRATMMQENEKKGMRKLNLRKLNPPETVRVKLLKV